MGLAEKISSLEATVGVMGLGYAGLPFAAQFCRAGYTVIGFDVNVERVRMLSEGKSPIGSVSSESIAELVKAGRFTATSDFSSLASTDAIAICVPTPLTKHREPDLQYIRSTAEAIAEHLQPEHLVILQSTTYPGTTEEVVLPILSRGGRVCGKDFYLAYSPEREDPGNPTYTTASIPKVVGGIDKRSLDLAVKLLTPVVEKVLPVSSASAAEATKILENIYRSVNIALVNEMKILFDKMGIDIWEVIQAASTKPFGFHPFYPGPGLGGHCIPIDPFYLTWKAREYQIPTRFIELAGEVNTSMPYYVLRKSLDALNDRGVTVRGAKVLVLGAAYKADVDDPRESPAIKLMELFEERGATVSYHDPHVPKIPSMRHYKVSLESVPLTEEAIRESDLVLIATA
ncbi:MAG: nucleotide sugar dehydrogenase, partial [Planctomycetota bacterium]|nr:nucleotide sugar dehydrogenase [Planctomycetota bacterium]